VSELSDIFAKDPLIAPLTEIELEAVIAYYKERRGSFDLVRKDGSMKRRRAKSKPKAKVVDPAQIDIEEILKEENR
jgi:hypothetical protein